MKKTLLTALLAACLLLGACSGGSGTAMTSAMSMDALMVDRFYEGETASAAPQFNMAATTAPAAMAAGGTAGDGAAGMGETPAVPDDGRKLIRTGYYDLETLRYPQTIQEIEALVNSVGGYIQRSTQSGGNGLESGYQSPRSATYILRVPADAFFAVGRSLGDIATVISSEHSVEEVTDFYYDTEARLATLRVQEERLLTLMSQATELEAVILLEERLSEVRYSIESFQGQLRRLDSQIGYSTLTVYVREVFEPTVFEPTPVTLGQRIASRFKNTLSSIKRGFENLLVVVLGDGLSWLINLAILALIAFAVWKGWRAFKARQAGRAPAATPRKRGQLKPPAVPTGEEAPTDDSAPPQDGESR